MLATLDTVPVSGRTLKVVAVALLMLLIVVQPAAAQDRPYMVDCPYDDLEEALECAFLPPGATLDDDPRKLLFGIVLPFLLMFAIFRLGLKKAFGSEGETDIIALVLALFVIPSGGYRFISELFLGIGGLGADGFDEDILLAGLDPWQQQLLAVFIVAIVLTVVLLYKGDSGTLRKHEFMLVAAVALVVWLATGGMQYVTDDATAAAGETLGMIIVALIGLYLLYVFLRSDKGIGTMAVGFVGLMIIAWVLASLEGLGPAQQLGELITAGGITIILGLILAVVVFFIIGASGGGSTHVIGGFLLVIVIMIVTFTIAAGLMMPIAVDHESSREHGFQRSDNHNLYKPAAETRT